MKLSRWGFLLTGAALGVLLVAVALHAGEVAVPEGDVVVDAVMLGESAPVTIEETVPTVGSSARVSGSVVAGAGVPQRGLGRDELRGRVVNDGGYGVSGVHVTLFDPARGASAWTGTGGAFGVVRAAQAARPHAAHVLLEHTDYATQVALLGELQDGTVEIQPLTLTAGGSVTVRVRTPGAASTAHVRVTIEPRLGSDLRRIGARREVVVPAGEATRFEHIASGEYCLVATGEGLVQGTVDNIRVEEGVHVDLGVLELLIEERLAGRVVDAVGAPVPGAEVRCFEAAAGGDTGAGASGRARHLGTCQSGADGAFEVPCSGSDEWQLEASAAGYRTASMVVAGGSSNAVEVTLRRGLELCVVPVGPTGEPALHSVESATLTKLDHRGGPVQGSKGERGFHFPGCDAGPHMLEVRLVNGMILPKRISVVGNADEEELTFVVPVPRELRGTVVDRVTGRPLEGSRVGFSAVDGQRGGETSTHTGADGQFSLAVTHGRPGRLMVSASGFADRFLNVETDSDQVGRVALHRNAIVRGKVRWGARPPKSGCSVAVFTSLASMRKVDVRGDGSFEVMDVEPGDAHVYAFEGSLSAFLDRSVPWVFQDQASWPAPKLRVAAGEAYTVDVPLEVVAVGSLVRTMTLGANSGICRVAGVIRRNGVGSRSFSAVRRSTVDVSEGGEFTLEWDDLPVGTYGISVTTVGAGKRVLVAETHEIFVGEQRPQVLQVPTARLRVELTAGDWAGLASTTGLVLSVEPAGAPPSRRALSGPSLEFVGLPPGPARVRLLSADAEMASESVELTAFRLATFHLRLD